MLLSVAWAGAPAMVPPADEDPEMESDMAPTYVSEAVNLRICFGRVGEVEACLLAQCVGVVALIVVVPN